MRAESVMARGALQFPQTSVPVPVKSNTALPCGDRGCHILLQIHIFYLSSVVFLSCFYAVQDTEFGLLRGDSSCSLLFHLSGLAVWLACHHPWNPLTPPPRSRSVAVDDVQSLSACPLQPALRYSINTQFAQTLWGYNLSSNFYNYVSGQSYILLLNINLNVSHVGLDHGQPITVNQFFHQLATSLIGCHLSS